MHDSTAHRPLILAAVMSAMFMIAIEATIISTAMPQIAAKLGDLHLYSWVFSSFLLAQTATTIPFGKLSDMYGRKPVLLVGVAIFLVGSALCGFAHSMPELIVYRLVQGFGAGAIQPMALTIVGDLYPGNQRGKVQGYLSSVWGLSSVVGPMIGGLITQYVDWAWVFWINIPVGIITAFLFGRYLREEVSRTERRVDWKGALLFTASVAGLMLALTEAGDRFSTALWAAAVFVVCGALFIWQERRASDPMVAFELWLRRPIATANAAMLLAGMALIGLTAFLPMYVQGVLGQSALVAGFTLTAMSFGWPIGAMLAARVFLSRLGLRGTMVLGGLLMPVGAAWMLLLGPGSSPYIAGTGSLIMGLGMGLLSTSSLMLIQGSVPWSERGAVTASNVFARMLGSTFGATVLGGVLNVSLAHHSVAVSYDQVRQLLDGIGAPDRAVREALGTGLHLTFWSMFLVTLSAFAAASLVPREPARQPAS